MDLENKKLGFTTTAQGYLKSMAGWGMFLAIVGFISAAFSIINLFGAFRINALMGVMSLGVLVLELIAAIGLFGFASKVKNALDSRDGVVLDTAFKGLATYFMFMLIALVVRLLMVFAVLGLK